MGIFNLRGLLLLCVAALMLGGCASQEPADSGPDVEPMEQELDTSVDNEPIEPAGPMVNNGKIVQCRIEGIAYFNKCIFINPQSTWLLLCWIESYRPRVRFRYCSKNK